MRPFVMTTAWSAARAAQFDRDHPARTDNAVNSLSVRIHAFSIQKKALPEQGFYGGRLA
jgi:hypothetical protein